MKNALLLIVLMLAAIRSPASTAGEEDLKSILSARTYTQFMRTAERNHRIAHVTLVCDAQLRGQRIPVACFEVISLEAQRADTELSQNKEWLGSVCLRRVSATKDWQELREASRSQVVPPKCRASAESRLADLQYTDQSDRPAELFRRRFD